MSVGFSDLRAMLGERPNIAWTSQDGFQQALDTIGIVLSDEDKALLSQLARVQNVSWPQINHPRAALYASAYPDAQKETRTTIAQLATGDHAATRLCSLANADLRVYELDTQNPAPAQGLGEEVAAHAISYGLMACDEKIDLLLVGSISAGMTDALQNCMAHDGDPFEALARYAGHDLCAIVGATFSARMAKTPVLCDAALLPFLVRFLPEGDHVLLPSANSNGPVETLRQLCEIKIATAMKAQPKPAITISSAA